MDSDAKHDLDELAIGSFSVPPLPFTEDELVQLSILRGEEIDELVSASLLDSVSRFDESLLNHIVLPFREIKISLSTGHKYPAQQLQIEYENVSLPRLVMDALRIECRKIIENGSKKNNIEAWERRDVDELFDYDMTALHVATFIDRHLKQYREQLRIGSSMSNTNGISAEVITWPLPYEPNTVKNTVVPSWGIDLSAIKADIKASSILNKLPEEICSLIPEQFRILHIESVLRTNLYEKFLTKQSSILEHLKAQSRTALRKCIPLNQRSRREDIDAMAEYLVTPKMTFHGTSNQFVPSIVRHGFLAPGAKHPETHEPLPVRCGTTYGQGIYSSPSPAFSLSYSGSEAKPTKPDGFWGMKLFVCATIMGRSSQMTREDNWYFKTKPMEGADSHVGNNEMEYIVFDNAQILPCYVIHLDWGAENAKFFKDIDADKANFVANQKVHPKLVAAVVAPGDRQREKEALIAKASKYFPYGYGPASGTSFVIEDVGEVDEDEEEYGDYQQLRVDETHENTDFWEWDDSLAVEERGKGKGSNFDEYTSLRDGWCRAGSGK